MRKSPMVKKKRMVYTSPMTETNNGLRFKSFFSHITNTEGFGQHIDHSIPGYAEHRARMAVAVGETYFIPNVLDVGASEGQWGKAIQEYNPYTTVLDLDPNPDMVRNNVNPNSEKVTAAWECGFEDNGAIVPAFTSRRKFHAIGMHMVRQFVTRDGDDWYKEAAHFLTSSGIFMLSVKCVATPGKEAEWAEREEEKNRYKAQFFTAEEMTAKAESVLVGMHELMMTEEEEMETLKRYFKHVVKVWHSGNFLGFFAGNDEEALRFAVRSYNS